ncbi:hypothetical protein L6R52_33610 [Myxococcota bacterium]|nr:hypothetical protein [Myxococcota bacterium]
MGHADIELIRAVLAGDQPAARTLVKRLTPVIQRSVNGALLRRGRASRTQMVDLTQDIFRILFEQDGKILRSWDPERGASLEGMISLVAERRAASLLSAGKRTGWAEDLHDFDTWEPPDGGTGSELRLASRQLLERILEELKVRLSDRGWLVFWSLFVEEHDVERVMREHQLTRDAVYTWRSRLQKAISAIRRELESDPATSPGRTGQVA